MYSALSKPCCHHPTRTPSSYLVSGARLRDKEFQGLFAREEAAKLKEIAGKVPKGAVNLTVEFVKSLIKK